MSIYEYLYKNRGRELYVYYLYQQIRYVRNASIRVSMHLVYHDYGQRFYNICG